MRIRLALMRFVESVYWMRDGSLVGREELSELVGRDVYDDLTSVGQGYRSSLLAHDDHLGICLLGEPQSGAMAETKVFIEVGVARYG